MKQVRKVNGEKLKSFGFSTKEIEAAEHMEKAGLFEMEPSQDLIDRTIAKCAAVLNQKEVVTDDVPVDKLDSAPENAKPRPIPLS